MIRSTSCLIFILSVCVNPGLFGQHPDTTTFRMNSRLNFYSWENRYEFILHIPASQQFKRLDIKLEISDRVVSSWKGVPGGRMLLLQTDFDTIPGNYNIVAQIRSEKGALYEAKSALSILQQKSNEVKTDRFTGGLIVNRRQFFPFGLYCYSPVDRTLPEEEAVRGFNMISPYQKILPGSFNDRKAYMDRCAKLGMKVHYNLLSVSGGGGVASRIEGLSEARRNELLVTEIRAFMDHPALLAWYISDEPNGNRVPPDTLVKIYRLIKSVDPWHPVSIVIMTPFTAAKKYSEAMDIVMADPYPVPDHPLTMAGDAAALLQDQFRGVKPVWIVPQAFGGGELWSREPTLQEIRSMTYQAIVGGARGIQYFVRQGPSSFPKSIVLWNECGKMAQEIAAIAPFLLSDDITPPIRSNNPKVAVCCAKNNDQLLIIAVNRDSNPLKFGVRINGIGTKPAKVIFENREIKINGGYLEDLLPSYGSQVYIVNEGKPANLILPFKGNMIKDPGFEDLSSFGAPASCYAWNEGDRGATFRLDPGEHFEGNYSLRMITPENNKGPRLRFFPLPVTAGRTYCLTVRAKSDPAIQHADRGRDFPACFEMGLGGIAMESFSPATEWKEFVTFVTIPSDNTARKVNVTLRVPCEGVVWFDMLQVFEATDINRSIDPGLSGNY